MKPSMREHIIATASDLFKTRGINATGVDTIAATADISKVTLYKYFRTKEDLVMEIIALRTREFCDWLTERLNKESKDPSDKLNRLFDCIEEWIRSPESHGLPFMGASAEFPQPDSPINKLSAELANGFQAYLTDLANEAGAKSPETLGQQLSMLIEGAILSEQLNRAGKSLGFAREAAMLLIKSNLA
ncbi:TetR family transcriptional regulator [Novimethylophilus kurashikiensis]|uniref:TetR family transcriptional regulator n=2 Tax=Novimethylophilus kurashikiensis TaxID=1825523 RepID=A0A2R5F8F8_9PROT|nr:TetR family transcriptional regulator [Novimethylophilus kurashikiensis]